MNILTAPLVGMKYHPGAAEALSELGVGDPVILRREPENPHDENAIQVLAPAGSGDAKTLILLGYIAREYAADWSPVIDEHGIRTAKLVFSSEGKPRIEVEFPEDEEEEEEEEDF